MSPLASTRKTNDANDLRQPEILRVQGRAQKTRKSTPEPAAIDPELAAVVAAWPKLPKATRRKIVAMIGRARE